MYYEVFYITPLIFWLPSEVYYPGTAGVGEGEEKALDLRIKAIEPIRDGIFPKSPPFRTPTPRDSPVVEPRCVGGGACTMGYTPTWLGPGSGHSVASGNVSKFPPCHSSSQIDQPPTAADRLFCLSISLLTLPPSICHLLDRQSPRVERCFSKVSTPPAEVIRFRLHRVPSPESIACDHNPT